MKDIETKLLLEIIVKETQNLFSERIKAIFKIGSLGKHGDFSSCSDIDIALLLDKIQPQDNENIKKLSNKIQSYPLLFSDRVSIFWSSYQQEDFSQGKGRFPALDRLDLLQNGEILIGEDHRRNFLFPKVELLILESAQFLLHSLLTQEKCLEIKNAKNILQKGARYFSKFVLFPVRLKFSLDHPTILGSNKNSVEYYIKNWSQVLFGVKEIIEAAYTARNLSYETVINLDPNWVKKKLVKLYIYCITQYINKLIDLKYFLLVQQLNQKIEFLINA